jgi:hypothetical protein
MLFAMPVMLIPAVFPFPLALAFALSSGALAIWWIPFPM